MLRPPVAELFKDNIVFGESIIEECVDKSNNTFKRFLSLCLIKNIHRLKSIKLLCENGLGADAVVVLRPMLEGFIDAKYIAIHKERMKDLEDYDLCQRLKSGNALMKKGEASEELKKRNKELIEKWDKVKARFINKNGGVYQRWSGKDKLSEMAKEVGIGGAYDYLWWYLCDFSHSSPVNDHIHLDILEDKSLKVNTGGTVDSLVPEVSKTALVMYSDFLFLINTELDIKQDEEITSLKVKTDLVSKE